MKSMALGCKHCFPPKSQPLAHSQRVFFWRGCVFFFNFFMMLVPDRERKVVFVQSPSKPPPPNATASSRYPARCSATCGSGTNAIASKSSTPPK